MTSEAKNIGKQVVGDEISYSIENVLTGGDNRERHLLYQLKISMAMAESIDIIVSFLMESGVKILLGDLQGALDRGVPVRIMTGNYLGITQPSALYLIKKELGGKVDLRLYNEPSRSFHPKAYIFHNSGSSHIYVGSSNISFSALTSGIEWNYRLSSQKDPFACQEFMDTFEDLFRNHSILIDDDFLKAYSRSWHRPAVSKDLERYGDYGQVGPVSFYEPRGAQIEALYALQQSREEGAVKGLVHAATGVGKTYLAAFDSKSYKRVLFVAHREEILHQAAVSFANVRGSDDYGFFTGKEKTTDRSVIFASVASLGQARYLNIKCCIDKIDSSQEEYRYQKFVKEWNETRFSVLSFIKKMEAEEKIRQMQVTQDIFSLPGGHNEVIKGLFVSDIPFMSEIFDYLNPYDCMVEENLSYLCANGYYDYLMNHMNLPWMNIVLDNR